MIIGRQRARVAHEHRLFNVGGGEGTADVLYGYSRSSDSSHAWGFLRYVETAPRPHVKTIPPTDFRVEHKRVHKNSLLR